MSIMSKYVVSTMIVHHPRARSDQRGKQHEPLEGVHPSGDEEGWWRWFTVVSLLFPFAVRHLSKN